MRKLLLTSAAVLGVSVGLTDVPAMAQGTMPMAPTQGMPAQPGPFLGGNNMLNSEGGPLPKSPMAPVPGSIVVHLNGRVNSYASLSGSSADKSAAGKNSTFDLHGYMRLYPGVDALAANGLRYGGITEIRQNFGNVSNSNTSTGASGQSTGETLYVRRAALYLGTDDLGLIRIGQDDGPFSQLDGGKTTFQFNDGAWNGDGPATITGTTPTWPFWSGIGNEYTITKIVYLSPQFAGIDFGLSYAPNNSANRDSPGCAAAGTGCTTLSSSSNPLDSARAKNMVEIMGRYRGVFGGVGIYGIAGYAFSGHVDTTAAVGNQYDGFSVGDVGLAVSYAGFSVGGNVLFGDYNGQVALKPKGGKSAIAWVAGVTYSQGPMTLGASYFNYQSQGQASLVNVSQRTDSGVAVSANYGLAPGLNVFATYLYGWVHQGGASLTPRGTDSANGQTLILGTRVLW